MKKILSLLFLSFLIIVPFLYFTFAPFTAYLNQYIYFSSCDIPLRYRIGTVDSRFNISKKEFLQDVLQAEAIWENLNSKNMLEYDPNGKLSVDLEYDNRQSLNIQIGQIESKLSSGKSILDSSVKEYEALADQFNQKLKSLNDNISYWNNQGGAPPEDYAKIIQEQEVLNLEAQRLNEMAKSLNFSTSQYNNQVGKLNQTINSFKRELSLRPEEGLYEGQKQKITIYITSNRNELIHTLAHEIGHALKIEHNFSKDSIMFPFSSQQLTASPEDKAALDAVCEKQNKYEVLVKNLYLQFQDLVRKYKRS